MVDELSRTVKAGLHDDQQLIYPGIEARFEAAQSAPAHRGPSRAALKRVNRPRGGAGRRT